MARTATQKSFSVVTRAMRSRKLRLALRSWTSAESDADPEPGGSKALGLDEGVTDDVWLEAFALTDGVCVDSKTRPRQAGVWFSASTVRARQGAANERL